MTDVPALTRGLDLLETIAAAVSPPTFVDLWHGSGLPKASVARLLACLRTRGYVAEDVSSGYRMGPRAALLAPGLDREERMAIAAAPVVAAMAQRLGHSAIAHSFADAGFTVLASSNVEDGVVLAAPGTRRTDCSGGPWGVLAWLAMHAAERDRARRHLADAETFERDLPRLTTRLARDGAVLDDGRRRPGVHRLAVPVRLRDGRCVAAIGIGALATALNERALPSAIAALTAAAQELAASFAPVFAHPTSTESLP